MFTIDETAPVIVRLSTTIDAPLERVWALHTNVDAWPSWNADVDRVELDGPLLPGNSFSWKTHGLDITSTVREIVPGEVRLSTTIDAPLERVWALHTNVDAWPSWNADVDRAELDGPLLPGNSFSWKTHGLDITSTVREIVPGERLVWGGPAGGIEGVHVWTFGQTGGQVTVHTEESWSGASVDAAATELGQALRESLTAWLAALKARAERTR